MLPTKWLGLVGLLAALSAAVGSAAFGGCAGTPACDKNSDCEAGACRDGRCVVECAVAALDCPKGYLCNALGQCEFGGGEGAGGHAGATSVATAGTGGGAGGGDAAVSVSSGATSGTGLSSSKLLLDRCDDGGGCADGLVCRAMVPGGTQRCTRACDSSATCPHGTRCIDLGASGTLCVAQDVGRACNDAVQCNHACLLGQGYCTMPCATGADCPNGYGCMPVGSPAQRVCVKAEAVCSPGAAAACIAPAACDTSLPMVVSGCTLACDNAADCPRRAKGLPPWVCDGLCRRPPLDLGAPGGQIYGPLPGGAPAEYHCGAHQEPVNVCNDGQSIVLPAFTLPTPPVVDCDVSSTVAGLAGDTCVDSCRYAGGCPDGFSCVAVGGVGAERVGLCLRQGAGDPGVGCAHHADCAFGYCFEGTCSRDCTVDGLCPNGTSCQAGPAPTVEGMTFRRCL